MSSNSKVPTVVDKAKEQMPTKEEDTKKTPSTIASDMKSCMSVRFYDAVTAASKKDVSKHAEMAILELPDRYQRVDVCYVCGGESDSMQCQNHIRDLIGCTYPPPNTHIRHVYYTCKNAACIAKADLSLGYHLAHTVEMIPIKSYIDEYAKIDAMTFNRFSVSTGQTYSGCKLIRLVWSAKKKGLLRLCLENDETLGYNTWEQFAATNAAIINNKGLPRLSPIRYPAGFPQDIQDIINPFITNWNSSAS
jgi:hypothetical protein